MLRQRVSQLESERDGAHLEVEKLRGLLDAAVARQDQSDIHIRALETQLRKQAEQHEAALLEAHIRERRQDRRLNLALIVAVAAFLLGIAISVTGYLESRENAELLAGINQGIRDIQVTMKDHQARLLQERAALHVPPVTPVTPPAETVKQAPADGHEITPLVPVLPEPDFVASGTLPLLGHTFSNRQDVRAFFEENARQPGVNSLPGGVQYRVLIPGTGRTPEASDKVVIEYRAFRPDGTELDNSFREMQPSTLVVSEALPGLREALQHMQENAQWELYVPPALVSAGVRKRGRFGFEPLIYTVELLSIAPRNPDSR
jgi:hypothetical protein